MDITTQGTFTHPRTISGLYFTITMAHKSHTPLPFLTFLTFHGVIGQPSHCMPQFGSSQLRTEGLLSVASNIGSVA